MRAVICYPCVMARFFNTAGACEPEDHYMLSPERRLPEIGTLIDQKADCAVVPTPRRPTVTGIPQLVTHGLSREEYLATPRQLGWLYEYFDGTMYVRRCSAVVPLILIRGDLKPSRQLPPGTTARPVTEKDEAGLRCAFEAAFWGTADFPDCTP